MSIIDFVSPSFRAASSDLTIAVSPLGLVELADEEFEVHGPRITRYQQSWAFYLGMQWGYMREIGEAQLTFNYVRALSDYLTNFCFSKGVTFEVPKENEGVIPAALDRIWNVDNDRDKTIWEIAQNGSVAGDSFVKIAYEDPWTDPAGNKHPGKVKILPLNASFCLDEDTEILTSEGWKDVWTAQEGDQALCLDPETDEIRWEPIQHMNRFDWDGPVNHWSNDRFEAVSTDDHRWVVEDWRAQNPKYQANAKHRIKTTAEINELTSARIRLITGGGTPLAFAEQSKWSDEFVETVGWYITEGHDQPSDSVVITQSENLNPEHTQRIRALLGWWKAQGAKTAEYYYPKRSERANQFRINQGGARAIKEAAPNKQLTPKFLCSLTYAQARLLYETLLAGDGGEHAGTGEKTTTIWYQSSQSRIDSFQMLCAMLGLRTQARFRDRRERTDNFREGNDCAGEVTVYKNNRLTYVNKLQKDRYNYRGIMWCPTTLSGTWFARKKGMMPNSNSSRQVCYWTGNCFPEWAPHDRNRLLRFKLKYKIWGTGLDGTRQVFTYVELITDEWVEEYINDELVDSHPNSLGQIPIVHIPNRIISSSPWGLSDIQDIIGLNRQYNETATILSDIINYHAAPTTIVLGAKSSQLEKGAKKIWGGIPKDANIYNLELKSDATLAQNFMDRLKQAMHEMTGVPVTALGQEQAISNTSGVALQTQYKPTMQVFDQKKLTYGQGFERINEFALRTLFMREPEMRTYDPEVSPPLKENQLAILDPRDSKTFRTKSVFASPLPIDKLVILNEIMTKMQLGLESKRGALRLLGEESPDEKLEELIAELFDDAKDQAALDLLKAQLMDVIGLNTFSVDVGGQDGSEQGGNVNSAGGPDVNSAGGPNVDSASTGTSTSSPAALPGLIPKGDSEDLMEQMSTLIAGTKLPQRRMPDKP